MTTYTKGLCPSIFPQKKYKESTFYFSALMKELLFILDYYAPHRGGIENVFENIISRLTKKNYHIHLLTSRFDPTLPEREQHTNLTIYRIGNGRKSFFFHAFWKGANILSHNKQIQIIHASTYTSAFPASIL
jgi:hypothetical protein